MLSRLSRTRFNSVRGRLLLLIAVLTLPSLGIIVVLTWHSYRNQQRAIRAELANTARAIAGVVDTEIDRSVAVLQTLEASPAFRRADWESVDQIARRVMPSSQRWLAVVDTDGQQLVNTRWPNRQGIPRLSLREPYLAAMQAGRPYVSDLVRGPVAQANVIHVAVPYTAADGRLYGISIVLDPAELAAALDVRRFAPTGVISILDRQGRIIARNPGQREFAGHLATPDIVQETQEHAEGVGESVTLERIEVLTAFAHAQCGWSVAIGTPKETVVAAMRRMLLLGLGASLGVSLVALALAWWLAEAVVRNVDALAEDAARMARGDRPRGGEGMLQELGSVATAMQRLAETKSDAQAQLREARDRLQGYAEELERKVTERTASLSEAVAQMEEFSYTVSHDLRAPLRAIHGYATALAEDCGGTLGEPGGEYVRRIIRASDRMNRLTADLLNYSRVAKADLKPERVAVEPIIRGAVEHYAELHAPAAEVCVIQPIDDVLAHETSLAQVLANLLTNAAKFVRPGERPRIVVRSERRGDRVRVWVEDQGIGIPADQQAKLFRIFERAPGATGYEGTGVGLAIVRRIIEKSDGTCGVESDGHTGSRFWVELPAA